MLMDSSFFFTFVVAEIGFLVLFGTIGFLELLSALFFMVLRKYGFRQENIDLPSSSSSSPPSSPSSSSSPSSTPPSSLPSSSSPPSSLSSSTAPSIKWTHDVFPSFRGEDVRRNFLSHIQKEFRRKLITPFIDNGIKRGESIGPELIHAIRRSKVAVVLLSRNYASSKWCLDELVEIMKCKKELGQTVFVVFYEVDPSEVKKLTGEFGAVFKKTCAGKSKEDIERWRQAFAEVATIAGYDLRNWENEAFMIEEIVTEISERFISSTPSRYMEGLIGMERHMEKMKRLLCLGSDEVRMVGIWGPSGIGKTTIARFLRDQISNVFQQSVFMTFPPSYARPTCADDHDEKLHLEQQFLSKLINQPDIKIPHLGAAQDFVMGKKLLVIFDGVEQLVQLLAMPEARYFGLGSRIIITTQNLRLLNAFGIKHTYQVNFPPPEEALQIFCMSAFGQNSPYDGFEKLAWEVTSRAGSLPLGLKIMGSHLRGMSKEEWEEELPRLRIRLDGGIGSILKLSYDALSEEDKDLFLHIACFFVEEDYIFDIFGKYNMSKDVLMHMFSDMWRGLEVLKQRSLINQSNKFHMHNLLVELGREIVRRQSINEPGKRQFLVDAKETCEVLTDNTGSKSVIGIKIFIEEDISISERAFDKMSNLQLLRFCHDYNCRKRLRLPQPLNSLPPKLRILDWDFFPMTCLPPNFDPKFLVTISMNYSKLEKLWEGIQPLRNLKLMELSYSGNLKELPDLSTATNLMYMKLEKCSSLVELPSSIGNLINLLELDLGGCSSLMQLPSSIGNLTRLKRFKIVECSSLLKLPSSIENLRNLPELNLRGCPSLVELPSFIGNFTRLKKFNLEGCSSLAKLPSSIENLSKLPDLNLNGCKNLLELPSWIENLNLQRLDLSGCSNLMDLPSSLGTIIRLKNLKVGSSSFAELPSSIGNLTNLWELDLSRCSNLVELPSTIGNLTNLSSLRECLSLTELPSSIENLTKLNFLYMSGCSSLIKIPSSIGNLQMLWQLFIERCSKLEFLPNNINLGSLICLKANGCSRLRSFPEISTNIGRLELLGTLIKEVPLSIKSWSELEGFSITYCKDLEKFPHVTDIITKLELNDEEIEEVPLWVSGISNLQELLLNNCRKLVSIPKLPDSLSSLDAKNCDSLERLGCSFSNPEICLKFINCWNLNEEARDTIIQSSAHCGTTILQGREVPAFFTYRGPSGSSITLKLNQRCFPTTLRFKICIILVNKGDKGAGDEDSMYVYPTIVDKQSGYDTIRLLTGYCLRPLVTDHLYIYEVVARKVQSREVLFELKVKSDKWEIAEYGIRELYEEKCHVDDVW